MRHFQESPSTYQDTGPKFKTGKLVPWSPLPGTGKKVGTRDPVQASGKDFSPVPRERKRKEGREGGREHRGPGVWGWGK